jgi:hypothetical protein
MPISPYSPPIRSTPRRQGGSKVQRRDRTLPRRPTTCGCSRRVL